MFLKDAKHSSFAADETGITAGNVGQLKPLWKFSTNAPIGSAVTAVEGRLYFGDWAGTFWAMDARSGTVLWKQFVGVSPPAPDPTCGPGLGVTAQPVIANGTVYVGGGDSAVYALDAGTGEIEWRLPLADPATGSYLWSSITLANNSLYIGIASFGDCPLVRGGMARIPLDAPFEPVVRYFAPEGGEGGSVWSTPAVDETKGLVYVTTGNGDYQTADTGDYGSAMIAMDWLTLEIKSYFFLPLLPTDYDADWGSSPVLFDAGGKPYSAATTKTGFLWVVSRPGSALSGDSGWSLKLFTNCVSPEEGCGSISAPAFDGKTLFVAGGQSDAAGSTNGNVYAVDPVGRSVLWQHALDKAVLAPLTAVRGVVFASSYKGLHALDTGDGTELWNDGTATTIYSQPVVSNGVVYVTYANGDVVAYGVAPVPSTMPQPLNVTPGRLYFEYTKGGAKPVAQSFKVAAGSSEIPFTVESDSAWLVPGVTGALTGGKTTGTTSGTVSVLPDFDSLGPGKYSAKLTIGAAAAAGGSVELEVFATIDPPLPVLDAADIVSGASGGKGLAPGSLFAIYLPGVAGAEIVAKSTPLPVNLGGLSVTVGGLPAPLLYVGPNQINGQVPYGVPLGWADVTISSGGLSTAAVSVRITAAAPTLFLSSGSHVLAQNSDYSLNATDRPAAAGGYAVVYITGQGPLNGTIFTGTPVDIHNVYSATMATTATIGGVSTEVYFSGMAPGFVGLGQVNLKIPELPAGEYPVQVQIGGVASNTATLSVCLK